jgi:hypothetical protein
MRKTAILGLAVLLLLALATTASADKGGNGKGSGPGASPTESHLVVPDAVYGDTVVATANPGGDDVYVFAQCWLLDGTYVYAAYFPVRDGQAAVGPLAATTWANADANCTAQEGYFTRNGFGKWVTLAGDTFDVAAS